MARAPDTLKPYQPTIRNRISTALLGDAKASSVRGRFVKGLMGDTGLSATGLGIVDLLPFLQADEAGRQLATKGQRAAGAGNLALSVIPIPAVANKLVKPVAKKAAKGVARLIGDVVGEAAPSVSKIADAMEGAPMVAYHGSPKTDLSSVRTSERGALGPGAYFTPNEGVAARYAGPEGKTYAADLSGVFDGMHWPRNSSVNPYQVWRDQVAKLVEADPKRAEEIGAIAAKMQPQDGYPFFKRIAAMYGSEQDAQDLFRKAGFKGVAGHADGPEIAMFDEVPIHAPASRPIPVPVVGGPPRNAEGFSAPLDMSQEARMARAAEQGFTTPAFHGTNQPIQEFSPDRLGSASFAPSAREAFFATSDPRIAEGYAESAASKTHTDIGAHEQMVAHLESEAARLQRIAEKSGRAADWDAAEAAMQAWEDFEIGAMRSESTGQNILPLRLRMGDAPAYDAGGAGPAFTREALGADFADVVAQQKAAGARGVTFRNLDDTPGVSLPGDHYAVFNPADIRSSFDPFHPGGEARVGLPRPGDYKVGGSLPPVPVVMPRSGGAATQPAPVVQPKITAYHGSPHDFDQFSLDRIGTGEGAQAYGHGLYFAENEAVAKGYRDQISGDGLVRPDGTVWKPSGLRHMNVRVEANRNGADLDATIAKAQSLLPNAPPATRPLLEADIAELMELRDSGGVKANPGSMYQVGIDADPEHFLDWEKPLSEQSDAYRQRLDAALKHGDTSIDEIAGVARTDEDAGKLTGETIYDVLGRFLESPEAATSALQRGGVPGIKYLDQGSRNAGQGTRNFVVFDEKLITILKKYGWVPGAALPAAAVAEYTKENGSPPPTVPMV